MIGGANNDSLARMQSVDLEPVTAWALDERAVRNRVLTM